MRTAEVVIVGAGVMAASVAYHLAARGCRDVLVLERDARPGLGSTGQATGGFRAQFGTAINVRLSLLSREKLRRFREEVGWDPGYRECGYLFVAHTETQLSALRTAMALQQANGLSEVEEVSAADLAHRNPAIRTDGLIGGSFCATDGFLRPLEIMHGYTEAARRRGVRFEYGTGPAACVVDGGDRGRPRIAGVRTRDGVVATRCVVNAAGAWAAPLALSAGVEIPVAPLRRQAAGTYPFPQLPEDMPMTIFVADEFHLRVRDGRVLLLSPAGLAPTEDPFDTAFDPRPLPGLLACAREHVPCLAAARIDRDACWAGLYEMSPDRHALVGAAAGVEGFYLINGSSGHGVMHAPALGQLLAEIILDGQARTLDIHALRPSRFAEGEPNVEVAGLL